MVTKSRLRRIIRTIEGIPQQFMRYVSDAVAPVTRIFSPTDDNYPATGVQPFEGDPADKKNSDL